MTLAWLLLAVSLTLWGGGARGSGARRSRAPVPVRTLQVIAGAGTALGCLAAAGVGRGALVAAVAVPLSAAAVRHLHARRAPSRAERSLALTLDLIAVALRAGQPVGAAMVLAAPAAGLSGEQLRRVGGLLQLGAEPEAAWRAVADDPVWAPVAAAACRSATSGIRLAASFEQLAGELRAQLRESAEARAHRAGVLAAVPLGLCFLPAFVCLGIVPIVVGIARGALAGY